jgi:uncharacterized membrane-anchored protein
MFPGLKIHLCMKPTKLLVVPFVLFCATLPCPAEVSLNFDLKPSQVEWINGPASASLGKVAEIKVPAGYRFADAAGARMLLEKMNNPVPKNLVGLLSPISGESWVMFEFHPVGYVKDTDGEHIDAAAVLKAIQDQTDRQNLDRAIQKQAPVSQIEWAGKPVYDPDKHILEWAIRAAYGAQVVVNRTVRLLARNGFIDAIAVEPYRAGVELAPLKELLQGVSVRTGQGYNDFQQGDTVSTASFIDLITQGEEDSIKQQATTEPAEKAKPSSFLRTAAPWIAVGVAGLAGAGLIRRRSKRRLRARRDAHGTSHHEEARTSVAEPAPAPAKAINGSNGSEKGAVESEHLQKAMLGHRSGRRKKRVFNYQKFYTEMMMQSSSYSYTPGLSLRGESVLDTHENGSANHTNGHHNGNDTHRINEEVVLQATADLIASQKLLIREQARLIEDQSKLIEEKYRLLERQSEILSAELAGK